MESIITQISCGFYSLNDDTHGLILEFVGKKSYYAYGATNKRCREIYLSKEWSKETFLFGYAPLLVIQDRVERLCMNRLSVGYAVLYYNRRDVLEWAFQKKRRHILYQIFNTAVKVGRLDICNEIHDRSMEGQWRVHDDILSFVAREGELDTLKWLDTRSCLDIFNIRTCAHSAAMGGQLNALLWLQTKLPFDELMKRVCADSAAKDGKLNVLEWLHENGFSFDSRTIHEAANGGHLYVLEWLKDNGCSFDEHTFGHAAYGGHKHVLEWLIDNGCSLNEFTFRIAACKGNMHLLEWLKDNNCPWDHYCYEGAAEGGHLHVLDWLRDNECPRGDAKIDLYEEELQDAVVIWLRNNGFSMLHDYDVEYDSEDEYESCYVGRDYHYYSYEEYDY